MPNINPNQIRQIESAPANPKAIYSALGNIMNNSSTCRAKVESINASTGEYRITLTGTYSGGSQSPDQPQRSKEDRSREDRTWEERDH